MRRKPRFEPDPMVDKLCDALVATPIGETLTFPAILNLIGRNELDAKARSLIERAKARALKLNAHFENVATVGYRRYAAVETVNYVSTSGRLKVRRAVRRNIKKLDTVDRAALAPDELQKTTMVRAALGAMSSALRPQTLLSRPAPSDLTVKPPTNLSSFARIDK